MSIFSSIKETIKRYGNSVTIVEGDKKHNVTAFVEPLRYKNRVYVGGKYRLLGKDRDEKYLYIGYAENPLTEQYSVIEMQNSKYIVKRCETYYVKDYPIYVWAILTPYGDDLEDDYESDREAG